MNNSAKDMLDCLLSMTTFFENDDDRLTINVSGTHYEINVCDLINFPDTILGDPLKRAYYLIPGTSDYFFPRHSSSFESILYYFINDGILVKAETIPPLIFFEEIRFFELNDNLIQTFNNTYLSINHNNEIESNIWLRKIFYQPFYGLRIDYLNCLFHILSAVFNALAVYSLCLETMSIYQNFHIRVWIITYPSKFVNHTEGLKCSDMGLRPYQFIPYFNSENTILEYVCITWFFFELVIRILSIPSFIDLLNDYSFILDILSILPTILIRVYYRFYTLPRTDEEQLTINESHFFDYLTCFKLFRLFRLTRYAKCLEILFQVLHSNLKDILILTILILFGLFYFGLTLFTLEQLYPDSEIKNFGDALWHGFTVITTIGYSDIAEYQFLSYICAITGVWYGLIVMAITLPTLSQSFNIFHNFKYHRHIFK